MLSIREILVKLEVHKKCNLLLISIVCVIYNNSYER